MFDPYFVLRWIDGGNHHLLRAIFIIILLTFVSMVFADLAKAVLWGWKK